MDFMEKIVLSEKQWIEITSNISPRDFDKITILYKQYSKDLIWDIVLTMESIKLLLVDKSKVDYIEQMLDWKEWVISIYDVLEDWTQKVLDIILKMNDAKKKSEK